MRAEPGSGGYDGVMALRKAGSIEEKMKGLDYESRPPFVSAEGWIRVGLTAGGSLRIKAPPVCCWCLGATTRVEMLLMTHTRPVELPLCLECSRRWRSRRWKIGTIFYAAILLFNLWSAVLARAEQSSPPPVSFWIQVVCLPLFPGVPILQGLFDVWGYPARTDWPSRNEKPTHGKVKFKKVRYADLFEMTYGTLMARRPEDST